MLARVYIYYRKELHPDLVRMFDRDGNFKISKDGVQRGIGHACPRVTVTVESTGPKFNKQRLEKLNNLLESLKKKGEIADFQWIQQ
jgi:hypothetical protein